MDEVVLEQHERRFARIEAAWSAVADEREPHVATWTRLGWLGDGAIDGAEFASKVQADVAEAGAPTHFGAFVTHYNRMLAQRADLFGQLFKLGAKLGEGGFGAVVRGTHTGSS